MKNVWLDKSRKSKCDNNLGKILFEPWDKFKVVLYDDVDLTHICGEKPYTNIVQFSSFDLDCGNTIKIYGFGICDKSNTLLLKQQFVSVIYMVAGDSINLDIDLFIPPDMFISGLIYELD